MNCRKFRQQLDEYLSGELAANAAEAASAHLHDCQDCQQQLARRHALRAALRSQVVPPPSPGFFEHALHGARRPERNRAGLWARLAGVAVAATLVVWIGFNGLPGAPDKEKLAGVTIALHETRAVQLAFNSEQALAGVTLRIRLPEGVELQGFPEQREIHWRTDLARGVNMLSLPLTAVAVAEGALTARLEYGGRSTELSIRIGVDGSARGPQV